MSLWKKSEIKYSVNSQSRFYFLYFKCLVKIIDCVCSKLCHFHSGVAFLGESLICIDPLPQTFDPCWSKPLLLISSLAPNTPMYISQNPHIRTHTSCWHPLCYALFFPEGCGKLGLTPQSRKAGNQGDNLGKKAIWRGKKNKKEVEEEKWGRVYVSNNTFKWLF